MEIFAKPAVGAIIEKEMNGVAHVLIQERCKEEDTLENGLIEIPAGKVRKYESSGLDKIGCDNFGYDGLASGIAMGIGIGSIIKNGDTSEKIDKLINKGEIQIVDKSSLIITYESLIKLLEE